MAGGMVLAGGGSTRMGREKALLPAGGLTLLERAVQAVRAAASPVIVVGGSSGVREAAPGRAVPDLYPGAGPLGGIVTGLRALGGGKHIVLACDMPLALPAVLALLLASADGHDAAVPIVAGRAEPLCAVYDHRCAEPFARLVESGRRAVHAALQTVDCRCVAEDELRCIDPGLVSLTNVNTPEDYARLSEWSPLDG